jgi:hypothetical protein
MTPLDHDNATATVSITGLALGCYNQATQNYEVGFLRHDCHNLVIEVKKKLGDGEDSVMTYEIKDHQHRIFIDAENAVSPADPIYIVDGHTVDGHFDRVDSHWDREDFRWVIDFENDFNGGDPVDLRPPTVPVTEMYMSKPRLYADTDLFTPEQYLRVRIDPGTNAPVANEDPEVLGFFTQGIMADITCQRGGAVILRVEGPQGFHVHLPHGYGQHEISITNICTPAAMRDEEEEEEEIDRDAGRNNGSANTQPTDFRLYYSVIRDTNGERYDIRSPVHGEGAVCNGSNLGGRAALFPLPLSNP